jgi:hypothetical protein
MRANILVLAGLLGIASGCAPFMKLPPPEPVWAATAGPADRRSDSASLEQKAATERARAYIADSLPAHSGDFIRSLERQGFFCGPYKEGLFECIYSKAHVRIPCATALRVSIQATFPYESSEAISVSGDDIDVAAFVLADREHVDHRGCFPL